MSPGNTACPLPTHTNTVAVALGTATDSRQNVPTQHRAQAPGRESEHTHPPAPGCARGLPRSPARKRPPGRGLFLEGVLLGPLPQPPLSQVSRSRAAPPPMVLPRGLRLQGPGLWGRGVVFLSRLSPPPPLPLRPPSPDLFFSYIRCLKMALFKSIWHILRSEKGHVALLQAQAPPRFTTLFDFCDFKAEPPSSPVGPPGCSGGLRSW